MTDHQPTELLGLQSSPMEERTPFCPPDDTIAEYYAGTLDDHEQAGLQRHLADCRHCRGRLGMLSRLEDAPPAGRVPAHLLAAAKQLPDRHATRPRIRARGWAAAAVIVLALGLVVINKTSLVGPISSPPDETRQLRNIDHAAVVPELISPAEGAVVNLAELEIHWQPVQGSLYYDLYLMSDAGDLLLQERLTDTRWKATSPLPLEPGSEYFVRVEAHLADASTASSGHVIFKVGRGE